RGAGAKTHHSHPDRRRDGGLSPPVCRTALALADAGLAARTADRRRTRRNRENLRAVRAMAGADAAAEAVRQRRAGVPADRTATRILPLLVEPEGSDGQGHSLYAGRQSRRDRIGPCAVRPADQAAKPKTDWNVAIRLPADMDIRPPVRRARRG